MMLFNESHSGDLRYVTKLMVNMAFLKGYLNFIVTYCNINQHVQSSFRQSTFRNCLECFALRNKIGFLS